ncbi:MAG: MurR/RpiR family transcriptional regulator [Coprobacillaceae bacterium]
MSLLKKMELGQDFSSVEKVISKYILENGEDILKMSTKDLAKKTYTSPASIVRFCRTLDFKGYNEFKIALAAQLQYSHLNTENVNANYPFNKKDSLHAISNSIATLSKESIDITMRNLDYEELRLIVQMLVNSEVIDMYAVSGPLRMASDFQYKMFRIGKVVRVSQMINEQLFQAAQSTKGHVAILISYSGETEEVIQAAKILKKKQIPMIGITSFGQNQLANYCDRILYLNSSELIYSKISTFSSTLSLHIILDILYASIFARDYDENLTYKIETDNLIDHRHSNIILND